MLVIARHFVPPLIVNAALGTVLWTAYSESSSVLSSRTALEAHPIMIATISGAIAGGAQAIVAAPAENVRLAIERSAGGDWSHAWKEVVRGTTPNQPIGRTSLHELREVRSWMMNVRDMAGRGWKGWGWGLAKDVCGEIRTVSWRALSNTRVLGRVFCVFRDFRSHSSCGHGTKTSFAGSRATFQGG